MKTQLCLVLTLATASITSNLGFQASQPDKKPEPQAHFKGEDLRAADDEQKRFFLFGLKPQAAATRAGFKLLLVLPGGDGSAEFNSFVESIHRQALPDDFVVAQLVAPKWSAEQAEKFVWPRVGNPVPEARFTTEEFILDVIKEVKDRYPIDSKSIFALGWSSGGPPVYAAALMKDSPITGAYVAMSVFHPDTLPDLNSAKGKAFYLLHSPQDWIPIRNAERAHDQLLKHGANVRLHTYQGGHGWHGDILGTIRTGMRWLAEQPSVQTNGDDPP